MQQCSGESRPTPRSFDDAEPADDVGDASFTPLAIGIPQQWSHLLPALEQRWTVVFVPDGFTAADQETYNDYVDDALQELFSREPFASNPRLHLAVNVIRVNVHSPSRYLRDSTQGTLDPDDRTSFGMTLGVFDGALGDNRYAYWDLDLHQRFLDELVTDEGMDDWDASVIIGNAQQFGGLALGNLAGVNIGSPPSVVVHELGHLMGLADEYQTCSSPEEPPRHRSHRRRYVDSSSPNIAYSDSPPARVSGDWFRHLRGSWSSFTKEIWDVADRRTDYPDVPDEFDDEDRPEVTDDLVAMFEGTLRGRRNSWRSQWNCTMRSSEHDFCVACAEGIEKFLADHFRLARSNP